MESRRGNSEAGASERFPFFLSLGGAHAIWGFFFFFFSFSGDGNGMGNGIRKCDVDTLGERESRERNGVHGTRATLSSSFRLCSFSLLRFARCLAR